MESDADPAAGALSESDQAIARQQAVEARAAAQFERDALPPTPADPVPE